MVLVLFPLVSQEDKVKLCVLQAEGVVSEVVVIELSKEEGLISEQVEEEQLL